MPIRHSPMRQPLLLLAVIAATVLLIGDARAQAGEIITVDTLSGEAADGECSLAEAIEAANDDKVVDGCVAGSGDDTINIAVAGTITAPYPYGFDITSNMTVQGASGGTVITGNDGFDIIVTSRRTPDTVDVTAVTLADMTVQDSRWAGVAVEDYSNAGLDIRYSVTLENLSIHCNKDGFLHYHVHPKARAGSVHIKDSVIAGSSAIGVGTRCFGSEVDLSFTVENSIIRGNQRGISADCGRFKLVDSTVAHSPGIGVYGCGRVESTSLDLVNSTIAHNSSR